MSEETNKNAEQIPPKKSNSIVLILGAILGLALMGGGAWFYLHQGKTAQAAPVKTEELHTVHLEGFTVNLSDVEENHFLRVTIDLGLGHPPKAKEGESGVPIAPVRDAILMVLTSGKADVLITQDGKAQLKKDLLAALQQKFADLDVREIYFTEFLVQR
jgi:flagellar FliL protein